MSTAPAGQILARLVLVHLRGRQYQVQAPFVYASRAGRVITVPAGFVTDGGSIPRFIWPLYPPFGSDCDEGYVLHDYCYAEAEMLQIDRAEADALMREVHEVSGVRASARAVIWSGVRAGGWRAWREHRSRDE